MLVRLKLQVLAISWCKVVTTLNAILAALSFMQFIGFLLALLMYFKHCGVASAASACKF